MLSVFIANIRDLILEDIVRGLTEEQCAAFGPPRNWDGDEADFVAAEHGYLTPIGASVDEVNGRAAYVFTAKEAVFAWFYEMPPQYPDPKWSELVLSYDPFEGDMGDGTERTLTDEIRIAKRGGKCRECKQPILKGEVVRVIKKADSEGIYGGRCCRMCCDAMALSDLDGGASVDAQWAKGSR